MSVIESSPVVTPIEVAEPNEAQRILLAARDLIADESKWCVQAWHVEETYCALGAVGTTLGVEPECLSNTRIAHALLGTRVEKHLMRAAADVLGHDVHDVFDITALNDHGGHVKVMRLFNRAIELAGQR